MQRKNCQTVETKPFKTMTEEDSVTIAKLPPEVVQKIIGRLHGKDLLSCRLVSSNFKTQTDKVIGHRNQDDDNPNLIWSPLFHTELKCKESEKFLIKVKPGTTVVKTQRQINKFLKYAASLSPPSSNPFKNGALIYRAASRLRIPDACSNRDFIVVFDRPVAPLTNLFRLYGNHLTSFVFDCKNQSFYQFLTPAELGQLLEHLPNLKFLGINVPFKYGFEAPVVSEGEEITKPITKLPELPHLEAISLGQATSAVCCRGYGDGVIALEEILGAYGNQIKMLTLGDTGEIPDISDSFVNVFLEEDLTKQISFESLENLKVFAGVNPFELLQCIAVSPAQKCNLKRLSLQMKRCLCKSEKDFTCPLPTWWRSIPNIVMALMTRFATSLEELYVECEEREMDILHWIHPCKYEWQEDKEEHQRKFQISVETPCPKLKRVTLPADRIETKVMQLILERCVALEELSFLRGCGEGVAVSDDSGQLSNSDFGSFAYFYNSLFERMWKTWPTLQRITVLKDSEDHEVIYECTRKLYEKK